MLLQLRAARCSCCCCRYPRVTSKWLKCPRTGVLEHSACSMFLARWLFAGEFACSGGPGGIKDVLYERFRVGDPFEWVTGAGSDTSRCCALSVDALGCPGTVQRSYRHGRGLGIQHGGGIERGRSHVEPARGGCLCQACPGWMGSRQVLCGPRGGTCCLVPLFPKCSAIPLGCLSLLVFAKHRLHCSYTTAAFAGSQVLHSCSYCVLVAIS